ncbi:hypothetical protein SAMN04490243_1112 [Robiginitalea myxolifaciens]|uniref:Uncharacterized protein n=1 Tax=Robiginitalea myxolifaciens TaxID=400055 RepID=A0A1I6G214_9FLAO|nr:hypothetical protein [Robiginitalea myxolifaciens]SFR36263.1 hypothetical protein SAMN04490243_1112 [Robiginitalea myxolifaciens]
MNYLRAIGACLLIGALFFASCSTKKDAFVNRNWHALTTKYNVLYNGELAFEAGREQLRQDYRDNYWEILPVERLQVSGQVKLDSEDNNPNFLKAEEKATKAIQKHSMEIEDRERNPQTDEAFLLLGKARYFDERYIPAIEAFNYILRKYPDSDKLNEATIWREKTNIRLGYPELAIKNLRRLFYFEEVEDQDYADARAIMGQAFLDLNAPDSALRELKTAAAYARKKEEKARYLFIIGQLYNSLDHKDSANLVFDRIIEMNRRIPRVYLVNAHLKKIDNIEINPENRDFVEEYLEELVENRENRPFLDKIHRQRALFYADTDRDSLSLASYDKSLRATQQDRVINALNYNDLADYYFDENSYRNAGAYYDSVLLNLDENTRKFRAITKKRENLDDVIKYEEIVQYTDSVLRLYEMSPENRTAYFEQYVDSLKAFDAAEAEKKERRASAGFEAFAQSSGGKQNKGKFYFYNITSLGYGKTAFRNQWGERQLEDNWRWSNKARTIPDEAVAGTDAAATGSEVVQDEQRYSVEYYVSQIPEDPLVADSLRQERNFANYQLGIIYKEKFKELFLAGGKLELVLQRDPQERLILPSKYNLLKIYEELESPLAADMREDIIRNHPGSRYAAILTNPDIQLDALENSPDRRYADLYKAYRDQQYLQVITGSEESITQFTGDPIVPKLELLKANAIGRLQGLQEFKEALNYLALNYPNTDEGKEAQQIVSDQIPQMEALELTPALSAPGTANWKVVFPFKRADDETAQKLRERLEEVVKDLNYKNAVSKDIYNLEDQFVVVHGFRSKDFALGFAELIKKNKDYRIDNENFVILSSNYKVVQIHKNLQDYLRQVQTPKP